MADSSIADAGNRPLTDAVSSSGETDSRVPDQQLTRQAKSGDLAAFDELVRRYAASIYRVAYMMTHSHADADDLSQETFIRAFRSIGRYDEQFRLYTWLRRICVNLCLNHLKRKQRVRLSPLPLADGDDESADIPDPKFEGDAASLKHDLEQALAKLPHDQRVIFTLRVSEEMSYTEISAALGIPVGTVMSRLNRARTRLRELLREYMPRA
jgi:RNA polymerase sigma-70 factor (ECF subfamily)